MTPQYDVAIADIVSGLGNWSMWGRLGWQETKRRYRRTVLGPFWTTFSLGIFIVTLGILWAQLWKQDPKSYLPFLTSGMLAWALVSSIITEGCATFTSAEGVIKALSFSYTFLSCAVVWRNLIVLFHNSLIFLLVLAYSGVAISWNTILILPGLLLISVNGVWVATLLGVLCARFRDIQQIISSILQVSMFVTPIFWSPDQLGARFTRVIDYNVLFHFVEIIRSPMLGKSPASWTYVVVACCTVLGWIATFLIYSRFRRRIPYWL